MRTCILSAANKAKSIQEYHEYRFDWTPGQAVFYIDGKEANRLYTNIPSVPGRILVNHWTDGNANFSQGPPQRDAVMEVKNPTLFFNVSSSDNSSNGGMACQTKHQACSIDDVAIIDKPSQSSESSQPSSTSTSVAPSLQSTMALWTLSTTLIVGILCHYFA
jgi:beta-glucanase (GH16 family)